jgi:hypothetical protein
VAKKLPTPAEILTAVERPSGSATFGGETEDQFTFEGERFRVRYTSKTELALGTYRLFGNDVRHQIDITFTNGEALKCKASGNGDLDLNLGQLKLKRSVGKDGTDHKVFEKDAAAVRGRILG